MRMAGHRRARARGPGEDTEAGSVSVELAVATPLLLLLILFIVQFAVWWHANHIAQAAAAQALAAARAQHATVADGEDEATAVMSQAGREILRHLRVVVTRTGTRVHVRVDATAEPVVPGLSLPVHAVADGPVVRWTVPADGG
jgi:Flp pilus assembly protein TadG